MSDRSFEDTVKNLLGMKPKPHKPAEGGNEDGPKPALKAGSEEHEPDLNQNNDEAQH